MEDNNLKTKDNNLKRKKDNDLKRTEDNEKERFIKYHPDFGINHKYFMDRFFVFSKK